MPVFCHLDGSGLGVYYDCKGISEVDVMSGLSFCGYGWLFVVNGYPDCN